MCDRRQNLDVSGSGADCRRTRADMHAASKKRKKKKGKKEEKK
jgi:hypothetical protein